MMYLKFFIIQLFLDLNPNLLRPDSRISWVDIVPRGILKLAELTTKTPSIINSKAPVLRRAFRVRVMLTLVLRISNSNSTGKTKPLANILLPLTSKRSHPWLNHGNKITPKGTPVISLRLRRHLVSLRLSHKTSRATNNNPWFHLAALICTAVSWLCTTFSLALFTSQGIKRRFR